MSIPNANVERKTFSAGTGANQLENSKNQDNAAGPHGVRIKYPLRDRGDDLS